MANIDELSVQITSNSAQAVKGVEALAASLKKLKSATNGGLGLGASAKEMEKLAKATKSASAANETGSKSAINKWAKFRMVSQAILKVGKVIDSCVTKSNEYYETINRFNVSMGAYATEAGKYADKVSDVMGIDPASWLDNQSKFMVLATGFGVVGDRASIMSKNLTQLGYDLASFNDISYEDAMAKLQSGLAGELEPLRRIGYDLSQARLQQEAYTLGISKKVSAMTQAEKAELRYHAIMTQVTMAQGDMARTLDSPSNQLRIFKAQVEQAARSIGNMFIPLLSAVMPYLTAAAKLVRMLADSIARLVGFQAPEIGDSVGGLASGAESASDALGSAADNAKKLKKLTAGFDELNVLDTSSGSGSDSAVGGGTGFDFELPEYDFLAGASGSKVNEIVESVLGLKDTLKEIAEFTGLDGLWSNFLGALSEAKPGIEGVFEALSMGVSNNELNLFIFTQRFTTALQTALQTVSQTVGEMFLIVGSKFSEFVEKESSTISGFATNLLGDILSIGTEISNIWTGIFDTIRSVWLERGITTFSGIVDAMFGVWGTLMKFYNVVISPLVQWVVEACTMLWNDHLQPLWENLLSAILAVMDVGITLWNNILKPLVDWVIAIFGPAIVEVVKSVGDIFKGIFGTIADLVSNFLVGLRGVCDFLTGVFSGDWEKAWNGIKDAFGAVWNSIWILCKGFINAIIDYINYLISAIYSAVAAIVNGIGSVVGAIGDMLGKNWSFSIPTTPPKIPRLAEGGFVDEGQLFIAREAGAEMVGSIGRRTAVANNDQIVAGIASGVASANTESNALLREQNSLLRAMLEKESGVYLDGKQITKSVEKHQRERGRVLVTGGAY